MNVGIVVYSLTGNTFAVAESVKQALIAGGHSVSFETIKAKNEDPNYAGSVELTQAPQLEGMKCVVLGGPVRGFATAPIMKAYLQQLPDLKGLPVYLFVTHHFLWAFLGGNSAIGMTRKKKKKKKRKTDRVCSRKSPSICRRNHKIRKTVVGREIW